jgi:glycosyltransferase involved in cell wall biosynthesis
MSELVAHYRTACCFVSLSEHEGFAVPLLEAMRFGVPVVAYDAGAVAETLDGAGLLFEKKDLAEIAEACQLIRERQDLRDRLVGAGDRRLSEFATARVATLTKEVLGL